MRVVCVTWGPLRFAALVPLLALAAPAFAQPTPIVEYLFNETGTTAASTGTNTTPVTLYDTTYAATDLHTGAGGGVSGAAGDLAFDNSASTMGGDGGWAQHEIDVDDIEDLTTATWSLWYKQASLRNTGSRSRLIAKWDLDIFLDSMNSDYSAGLFMYYGVGDYAYSPDDVYPDAYDTETEEGTWVFVAITYDAAQASDNVDFYRGYRNATEAALYGHSAAVTLVGSDTQDVDMGNDDDLMVIGNETPNATKALDGLMDNVRIHGEVLSLAQLETLRSGDVGSQPVLLGDLDGDGFVGGADLDIVRSFWGQDVTAGNKLHGDPSGDGFVGGDDLDEVRAHWGEGTPPTPVVPEPSTWIALLGLALAGLFARRR